MGQTVETFDKDTLPGNPEDWPAYKKLAVTHAMRIEGRFRVQTLHGPVACDDGYLAVDAQGYPYPIAKEELELIYRPVGEFELESLGRSSDSEGGDS